MLKESSMRFARHLAAFALAMSWPLLAIGQPGGQSYPSKPVHVIVENRAGAGGTIGAAVVAKSPADGYTLLVHSAAHAYNPSIHTNLSFDTAKDFVEVVPLAGQPNVRRAAPS